MSVPVLGQEKWVTNPELKLKKLYDQAFVSDRSQSNIYHGRVTSIQAIIADSPNDVDKIRQKISSALKTYFGRYYSDVEVNVTASNLLEAKVTLNIDVLVTDGNTKISLGALIGITESNDVKNKIERLASTGA